MLSQAQLLQPSSKLLHLLIQFPARHQLDRSHYNVEELCWGNSRMLLSISGRPADRDVEHH